MKFGKSNLITPGTCNFRNTELVPYFHIHISNNLSPLGNFLWWSNHGRNLQFSISALLSVHSIPRLSTHPAALANMTLEPSINTNWSSNVDFSQNFEIFCFNQMKQLVKKQKSLQISAPMQHCQKRVLRNYYITFTLRVLPHPSLSTCKGGTNSQCAIFISKWNCLVNRLICVHWKSNLCSTTSEMTIKTIRHRHLNLPVWRKRASKSLAHVCVHKGFKCRKLTIFGSLLTFLPWHIETQIWHTTYPYT